MELIKEIGAYAGLVAFLGLALLALLSFAQGRDLRRLREWAGSAPERDGERKEATSAAASHKAEEMRKLEEARAAEREAAAQREQRRKRREEGLPEMTTAERLRERFGGGPDGGYRGGLRDRRYAIAGVVAAVLIAGGVAFAVLGGSDEGGNGGGGNAKGSGGGGGNAAAQVRPSEIEVTVLNGTATPGLAATYGDMVEREGFQLGAVTNSTSGFEDSIVMFEPGNKPEAQRVSRALDISRVRPMTSEIAAVSAGAPVSVVIGEDNASAAG